VQPDQDSYYSARSSPGAWEPLHCGSCIIRSGDKLDILNFGKKRKIPTPSSLDGRVRSKSQSGPQYL